MHLLSGLVLFFLITAPWHILVSQKNPEFFYFYFIEQHFLRYTLKEIGHYQPVWYFIPIFCLGFFPWIFLLIKACYFYTSNRLARKNPAISFLLIWAGAIFLFFSFSKSKLIPYILPVFPPAAMLTAFYIKEAINRGKSLRPAYVCTMITVLILLLSGICFLPSASMPDKATATLLLFTALIVLLIGAVVAAALTSHNMHTAFGLFAGSALTCLCIAMSAVPSIEDRSILPLANILTPRLQPTDMVITYNQYYQDLPFYLQRQVTILNWQNELTYGMAHQNTQGRMINDEEFRRLWLSKQQIYVILDKSEYTALINKYPEVKTKFISSTNRNSLVTNH